MARIAVEIAAVIAVVVVGVLLAGNAGAAEVGSVVALEGMYGEFVVNPKTGDLLALDTGADTATLYPAAFLDGRRDVKPIGPVKLEGKVSQAVFKRHKEASLFVIGFSNCPRLTVLEAGTLKAAARPEVEPGRVAMLSASVDPDDPLVYHLPGPGNSVGCLSLATMGSVSMSGPQTQRWPGGGYRRVAVSPDGEYFYVETVQDQNVVEVWSRPVKARRAGEWERVRTVRANGASPGPLGEYFYSSRAIFSADLLPRRMELAFLPRCAFAGAPVVVGLSSTDLAFVSTNDFTVVDRVAIPPRFLDPSPPPAPKVPPPPSNVPVARAEWPEESAGGMAGLTPCALWETAAVRPRPSGVPFNERARVLADDAHSRVLLAEGDQVFVVPLAKLAAGALPSLSIRFRPPPDAAVGVSVRVPLTLSSPACKVALKESPAGGVLRDGAFEWTPSLSQLGSQSIVMEVTAGKAAKTYSYTVNVMRPSLRLDFLPTSIEVRADGKAAVVWGTTSDPSGRNRKTAMALLDLEGMKVAASRELPFGVSCVAMDSHYVYVSQDVADRIECLSARDLSSQTYVYASPRPQRIWAMADSWLMGSDSLVWSVPDMKPVELPFSWPEGDAPASRAAKAPRLVGPSGPRRSGWNESNMQFRGIRRFHDGWYIQGRVFDSGLTTLRGIVAPGGLPVPALGPTTPQGTPSSSFETLFMLTAWNRWIRDGSVSDAMNQVVGPLNRPAILMPDLPLAARLEETRHEGDRISLTLGLHDLVLLEPLQSVTLADRMPAQEWHRLHTGRDGQRANDLLASAGRTVVVVVGRTVYVHPVQSPPDLAARRPLALEYPRQVPWVSLGEKATVEQVVVGGTKPYTFALASACAGVSIDSDSGALLIDGPALETRTIAEGYSSVGRGFVAYTATANEADVGRMLAEGLSDFTPRASAAFGRPVTGLLVLLPVRVRVADAKGQQATIQYHVVGELSPADLTARVVGLVRKRKKEMAQAELLRAQQVQARQAQIERQTQAPRAAEGPDPRAGQLEQRVERLEKRLQVMESQLDVLTKLLTDRLEPRRADKPK